MKTIPSSSRKPGFTLMEILVVIAIIVVLAAIAFPVISRMRKNTQKAEAMNIMKQLLSAVGTYAAANDGKLPKEDVKGSDDWSAAASPEGADVWYNALPKLAGSKGVADFANEKREAAFYTQESLLYLRGAQYPEGKKMNRPYFAISINGRLQRKDKDGKKLGARMQTIMNPNTTVIFLEQGLPGEPKAHDTMSKKDYDGAPKGSAKSFVTRYTGKGLLGFVGGNVREVSAKDILTPTGDMIWSADTATTDSSAILWTADPKEDPNAPSGQ
jgi:prepilin-type N-terminal cleavage/methylation domain-containing protein